MVMEASPSPQSVGREFVRQYYTLLNNAPAHLHRFYNNNSSFVHGGLDAPNRETLPVVGQKQIHNRIQQLNFRDCHAKISQVDSQATLGNGVVVQVTGELSNGGAPMRRFTQTFVLAAQSPKKYYVHNDIFRYQDIVFSDEEGSGSGRSEGEEEESSGAGVGAGYFPPPPAAFPAPFPAPPRLEPEPAPAPPAPVPTPVAPELQPQPAHHLNGHPPQHDDVTRQLVSAMQATSVSSGERVDRGAGGGERVERGVGSVDRVSGGERGEQPSARAPSPPREPTPPPPREPSPPVAPEPKTYANLLKSGSTSGPAQARVSPPHHAPAAHAPSHAPSHAPHAGDARVRARPHRDAPASDGAVNASGGGVGTSGGPGARRYSDAQQLFLGNLPHAATEDELRVLFARFGPVADLRVHCKPALPGLPKHPNYGFITFESTHAAAACLSAAPLYYPAEGAEGCVKLNVEEKKARAALPPAPRRRPPSQPRPPYRR